MYLTIRHRKDWIDQSLASIVTPERNSIDNNIHRHAAV